MDRQKSIMIGARIIAALGPLAKELNLQFRETGGTYGDGCCTLKIQASEIGADGRPETPERDLFRRSVTRAIPGLKPTDLDRKFKHPTKGVCRIAGLSRTGMLIFERDGKMYNFKYGMFNAERVEWVA